MNLDANTEAEGSIRTCVGGGGKRRPEELERFIYDDRVGLIFDVRKKAPGRGVWLTPAPEYLSKAIKGGFARGFKRRVEVPDFDSLVDVITTGIRQRMTEVLRVAARAGGVMIGATAVEQGMRDDRVELLLIAADGGDSTRKKFLSNADRKSIPTIADVFSGGELASLSGKDFVAVMAVDAPWAEQLRRDCRTLEAFKVFEG